MKYINKNYEILGHEESERERKKKRENTSKRTIKRLKS